jgi:LmbE family N-acetylglucosaminyl deacetylase
MRRLAVAAAVAVAACTSPGTHLPAHARIAWVVIAPHPDDETLIASGVLARAREAGEDVAVIVMTNGDYDCVHDGLRRQRESRAGLAALGVPEDRVFFLGYPDGFLSSLGRTPLPPPKRITQGACARGGTTYGDWHQKHYGAPAIYTRENAVADLAELLGELAPRDVAITHPHDTHPDHATTYALFRDAADRLPDKPRVHRALVHNGDCWPNGAEAHEPCAPTMIGPSRPTPPPTGMLSGYVARERLPVPASCLLEDRTRNKKLRAIAAHASQTRALPDSYLFGFARSDEMFFPETLPKRPASSVTPVRAGRSGARVTAGGLVLDLDATRKEARLSRGSVLLKTWPLPHDLWGDVAEEDFELAIDPRPEDGPVREVSLRWGGRLIGVAIDVSASPSARPAP